jgi:aryl-alcohol dehydrogenase-like predicted oxidoreductase
MEFLRSCTEPENMRWEKPIEETMDARHDVVRAGKARYLGASAMFAWRFQKALHVAEKHGWTASSRCRII